MRREKSSKLNSELRAAEVVAGAPRSLPGRVGSCRNAFPFLPWPFRQQVSNSCSSFLPLERSYHVPYVTDSDWSPSGCCKTCLCRAQGEIKCIWDFISPDFLLPRVALHLLPGTGEQIPWAVSTLQPSSSENRLLNICLEHLTLYLDILKVAILPMMAAEKNHQLSPPNNLWEEA